MAQGWPSWVCRPDDETGTYPRWNDIRNECVRETYIVAAPTILVLCVLLNHLAFVLLPRTRTRSKFPSATLCSILRPFLTLEEAETIEYDSVSYANGHVDSDVVAKHAGPPVWKTTILVGVALFETAMWTAYGCYVLFLHSNTWPDVWAALVILLGASTWVYAAVRPVVRRKVATPTYDLYLWYVLQAAGVVVSTGALLFEWYVHGVFASRAKVAGLAVSAVGVFLGLGVILSFPMGVPSGHVDATQIGWSVSPEDFTTLWGWITFSWVEPLLRRGSSKELEESDVWRLSSTLRSKPLFTAFSSIKSPSLPSSSWGTTWTLATHLVRANSRDLVMEAILTVCSVIFNYLGPFYLKQILDALKKHDAETRAKAYVLAGLAFVTAILKALSDAQHMWYGRRASSRMRSELMAVVYDKALKRKDAADMATAKKHQKGRKEKDPMKQEKAGIGKIVQLMSNDASRVGKTVSGAYLIYGAPFEIVFACVFLYQILGWSAFVGFSVLVIAMPINHFLSKRSVMLSRGLMLARDKRMDALNELILGIKFIKFFAWENQWIRRITKRRAKELTWLKHERINQMAFSFVWQLAPTMVAVVSFMCYVALGNELTVSIAFTSIALFNMVKSPLNVIPQWIVSIMQAGVSLGRIAAFLSEDEVPAGVSSLKSPVRPRSNPGKEMRIINGSFVWNSSQTQTAESVHEDAAQHQRTLSFDDDDDSETRFELLDVDLTIPEGKLTLVTGPTASGKTALLMALLGEMTLTSGDLILDKGGGVSFSAQTSWLEHKSIRENILFGTPYDEERYDLVLDCCALKPDLEIFEDGDDTEIGARGVSLSGGQKARVALARAIYAPTKRVLLDDPLAAVDSHTARLLINRLFMGPLMADRTVVLVTHHVELMLPCAHYLIRMYDGRIDMQGTVSDLRDQALLDYVVLDPDVDADADWASSAADAIDDGRNMIDSAQQQVPSPVVSRRNTSSPTRSEGESSRDSPSPSRGARPPTSNRKSARQQTVFTGPSPAIQPGRGPRKLVEAEARATGNVKWRIYKTYLQASGYFSWALLIVLIIAYQGFGLVEKFWLKAWGEAYNIRNSSSLHTHALAATYSLSHSIGEEQHAFGAHHHVTAFFTQVSAAETLEWEMPSARAHPFFYVAVYAAIVFAAAVMATVNSTVQFNASLRASRRLFDALLNSIVYSPIRYFDVTPAGRILNRMSRDMTVVDSSLSWSLRNCSHWLATFFAGVLTVSVILPPFLLPAAVIAWLYYLLALGYVRTARDLKRMESNSRSPIFSSFAELLEGIVTVRAFSAEQRFFDVLHQQIDNTTTMWYNFWMLNRWLLLHFDALASLSVFVTTIFAISGLLGEGLAAVTITTAMSFTQSVYWCCRTATNLEMDLNSVERVVEYLDLPQESNGQDTQKPPAYWPSSAANEGLISVENLVVRYAPELDPVLHGVSFKLRAREKVGLLGRTGSGKSTLAMSFLRFVEPSEGSIRIDGIDITKISLQDLRSKLTIIPQDPVLFSGTVRDNLDPFHQHTDAECVDVLHRVQLTAPVVSARTTPGSTRPPSPSFLDEDEADIARLTIALNTRVSAGGANFSQGQRQLFSLARALLRRNSIVIMDESTSSLDYATDQKIQDTIREEFQDALTITVAHRIRTIIEHDRLMVLDRGHIIEFDTPWNLIEREGGLFREMCLQSGTFTELRAAAAAKAGVVLS
ncbi:ABC transporter transmembrane region [Ceratobasidium sp. AG-Ba]|nr:ABC transporter transmembrane region [Ceratobasidium sp. AG-Ba]